jgi:ABC-type nitrate/sulfonate/bicarbonate transport system ATPase subunit
MHALHSSGTDRPVPSNPPALALDQVSATYRDRDETLLALDAVSLSIAPTEFVALVGPSGSGKSTLLDIVSGLFPDSAGDVRIAGVSVPLEERLGRTAYMRQRDLLLPWRTALENAALALDASGMNRRASRELARQKFAEFGLAGFEDAYPAQLSGGMRQRVAFLRTILAGHSLLLLDEPFGALDALNRVTMQTWLIDSWERDRHPVLLVTHDVDEAVFLADRVLVLSARPGTITHEENISLPRPRHRNLMASAAFSRHRAHLLAALGLIDEAVAP